MPGTYFKSGTYNGICDVCGFKFKFTELQKRWDGLICCRKDFEQDHPQKYIRVRESGLSVPVIRDRPTDVFEDFCTVWGSSAYADLAETGCALADNTRHTYVFLINLKQASTIPKGTF